jgi:hypothetical protein
MKRKKEYIVLVFVIVVLILYLVLHGTDRTHYKLPDISEIPQNKITQLEINGSGTQIVLNKKDNAWYIGPEAYPADLEKVKDMLTVIEKLTVTALVSESESYIRYDLNNDKKISVKAWAGKTLARAFDIGKSASTFRHTFIRLKEDPNVYHAREDFRLKFTQTIAGLRDKTVMSFDQAGIRQIDISMGRDVTVITQTESAKKEIEKTEKKEIVWQTTEGRILDQPKINRLLSALSDMECETYINDKNKADFQDPNYVIKLKGGIEYILSIFPKTDEKAKNYPAVSSENNYPFLLSDAQVDNIDKIIEEIIKTEE